MFDKSLLLPFHALRVIQPSGQDISSSGREAIVETLHKLNLNLGLRRYPGDDIQKIKDSIGWTWEVSKGDYKGKFTTRLSKLWHENGKEIGPEQLEKIGTIAKAHFVGRQTLSLDFDDTLEWNGGDFGDSGSCYFGGYHNNSYARTLMRNFGCLAVRFYDGEKGVGRAWLYCPQSLNSMIAWNFTGRYSRVEGGRAMSELLGLPYKTISLYNRANSSDLLYMSSESAVLIGPDKIDSYYLTKDFVEMCPCGNPGEFRVEKKGKYCDTCYTKLFTTCDRCGITLKKEDAEGKYCRICAASFFTCALCGEKTDDPYHLGSKKVCPRCYRESYHKTCSICGLPSNERVETIEGGKVCPICAETKVTKCEVCDKPSLVGKKRKTVDGMACRNCYVNYKPHKCGVCDKRHKQGEEDCEH